MKPPFFSPRSRTMKNAVNKLNNDSFQFGGAVYRTNKDGSANRLSGVGVSKLPSVKRTIGKREKNALNKAAEKLMFSRQIGK